MKYLVCVFVCVLMLTSCKANQKARNISIMENKRSLINSWYGKDHFKPGVVNPDDDLNKRQDQDSFESDAGEITINPSASSGSSQTSNMESQNADDTTPNTQSVSESNLIEQSALELEDESHITLEKDKSHDEVESASSEPLIENPVCLEESL